MHRIRLHARIALSCLALAMPALVGGCSKSDDSSGGGGGSGSGYAAPPTARPTLTGMAAVNAPTNFNENYKLGAAE